MSLPAPNLDNRTFQGIVDDVKRQIALRCPEWTDHNVSDPGVTLIELFAFMTEQMLYQANRVPERNYIKFLEMLGIKLEPRQAAKTGLRFRLSRFIEDSKADEAFTVPIERNTMVGTLRTDSMESIEFATDSRLVLTRAGFSEMVTLFPAPQKDPRRNDGPKEEARTPVEHALAAVKAGEEKILVFGDGEPDPGTECHFGFSQDIAGFLLRLSMNCRGGFATDLTPDYPSQVWEVWDSENGEWTRILPVEDTTRGFTKNGYVELEMPASLKQHEVNGVRAYWVKVRYTYDPDELPERPDDMAAPTRYHRSPAISGVRVQTVGGSVQATHCTRVYGEILGESDGTPGQIFRVRHSPMLPLGPDAKLRVGPPDGSLAVEEWDEYELKADFSESLQPPKSELHRVNRHFTCDPLTGQIAFGPGFVAPSGEAEQYGAVPRKGSSILLEEYAYGGGGEGNVMENTLTVDKGSTQYVADVRNPKRAGGGADTENIERAKLKALREIRTRNRAVTVDDFVRLTEAVPGVARAHCIAASRIGETLPGVVLGQVKVLTIPSVGEMPRPRYRDLVTPEPILTRVKEMLEECKLLTTEVLCEEAPDYVFVTTHTKIILDPRANQDDVAQRVRERLSRYLHPTLGGAAGKGWPFEEPVRFADLFAQVLDVRGVGSLRSLDLFRSHVTSAAEGTLSRETPVSAKEGIHLLPNQMIVSRQHVVQFVTVEALATLGQGAH